ncbi:hypothetical protein GHT09_005770 [Marmota monax]|uniref:Uncharacterized protein n=1 Tax=Marmota monax TaxID=9995 RepID=A0A834PQU9_MARMO|nr:hypothetical protein GHT09_005770 [Marmota monax]
MGRVTRYSFYQGNQRLPPVPGSLRPLPGLVGRCTLRGGREARRPVAPEHGGPRGRATSRRGLCNEAGWDGFRRVRGKPGPATEEERCSRVEMDPGRGPASSAHATRACDRAGAATPELE